LFNEGLRAGSSISVVRVLVKSGALEELPPVGIVVAEEGRRKGDRL
jgi:hypothetical protein